MKSLQQSLLTSLLCVATVWLTPPAQAQAEQEPPTSTRSPRILIVYYSLTGNTEGMAKAAAGGAQQVEGVTVSLTKVADVTKEQLESADGIILGCPTYFANIPGEMKTAMDDWNWKMKVDFTDKIGGAFSTGGGQVGGKEHVVMSLIMFMLSNRMIVAGPLYRNETTGSVWGEPGSAAMTGPLDLGVSPEELDAARRLGKRIATLSARFHHFQVHQSLGMGRHVGEIGSPHRGTAQEPLESRQTVESRVNHSLRIGIERFGAVRLLGRDLGNLAAKARHKPRTRDGWAICGASRKALMDRDARITA